MRADHQWEREGTAHDQTAAHTPAFLALRLTQHLGPERCSKPNMSRSPSSRSTARAQGSTFSVETPLRKRLLEHSVMAGACECGGRGGGGVSGTEVAQQKED